MRNLKRALSLALASVMLLGMMVVGTSAASYPDVDEKDNVEAIEVLNAVKVMIGDRGNFRPDAKVNRHEMAVIMAKLVLGNEAADNYVGSHPFTDVFPWADKYVAACYENGLVSGTSATTFSGNQPLTAVQAAAMMLRALGYKDLSKGASDWRAPVTAMANQIRLFSGVASNPKEELNRNQVAQLALNTLKSPVVDLKDGTFDISSGDGQVVITGGTREYIVRSSNEAYARAINDTERAGTSASSVEGYTIELGEHLYNGKLILRDNASDDFERPSRTWEYNGTHIGTYAKTEIMRASYTKAVTNRTLYDLLGRGDLENYSVEYYVNGVLSSKGKSDILTRNNNDFGSTGNGVLTEVYVNNNTKSTRGEITIVSINTWLAQASADYNTTRQTVGLKVWDSHSGDTSSTTSYTVDVDDVPAIEGLKKDDFVLVNMTGKYETGKMAVVAVSQPEIISAATVTEYSKGDSSTIDSDTVKALFKNVTANGTKYDSSAMAHYDAGALNAYYNELLTDKTYNVYLDKYGYALGVDLCEGEANYLFVTGYDLSSSSIAGGSVKANAIFLDGTVKTINVNLKDTNDNITTVVGGSDAGKDYFEKWQAADNMVGDQTYAINRWFSYVEKNGEYVLNPATKMFTTEVLSSNTYRLTIKCNSVRIDADPATAKTTGGKNAKVPTTDTRKAYGNDDSVFIVAELGEVADADNKIITGVDGLYTGVQNVEIDVSRKTTAATGNAETFVPEGLTAGDSGTDLVESIYTLFDSNNYIIGAVILGEAKGSNSNLAYIKSAATLERRVDDTYYWEFEAVVDGTIQTLTVKDKFGTGIKKLAPGHVQELRYDGQYVVSIKNPGEAKFYTIVDYATKPITNETIYDVGHKQNAAECGKTTCDKDIGYETGTDNRLTKTTASGLHLDGRTLYLKADQSDYGLTLVQDAKAVVHQQVNGKWGWFEYDSVKEAIDNMGDADGATTAQEYAGRITAVLDSNGVAKWVVFNSDTDYVTGNVVTTSGKVEGVTDGGIFTDKADIAKYLVPGAYSLRDNASGALKTSLSMTSEVKDCLWFVFKKPTASQVISLRIVGPDGKAYNESGTTANGGVFYVDVLGSPVQHSAGATGDLAGGVNGANDITWPAGEYTWQIVGATDGDLGHGTFTIVR